MDKRFLPFLGIGLLATAGVCFFYYAGTKDQTLAVSGEVLKVRTVELSPRNVFVITDFRIRNTSSIPFMLKDATIFVTLADGKEKEGRTLGRSEAEDVFKFVPLAGPKYNQVLTLRDQVPGKVTIDRMVGATFSLDEKELVERKSLRLHLADADGKEFDLPEKKAP